MNLLLQRYTARTDSTGGNLYVDDIFHCYTCEDEQRDIKIAGETRIPSGTYEIKLRDEGGMTQRYAQKFDFHQGMLWLQDVPGFEWVYIHVGNDDDDTEGCVLVGYSADISTGEVRVFQSKKAYSDLYKKITWAMIEGEDVFIEIKDEL